MMQHLPLAFTFAWNQNVRLIVVLGVILFFVAAMIYHGRKHREPLTRQMQMQTNIPQHISDPDLIIEAILKDISRTQNELNLLEHDIAQLELPTPHDEDGEPRGDDDLED